MIFLTDLDTELTDGEVEKTKTKWAEATAGDADADGDGDGGAGGKEEEEEEEIAAVVDIAEERPLSEEAPPEVEETEFDW